MVGAELSFSDVAGSGIVPFIDGHDLRTLHLGADGMRGLNGFEAAVVARLLQGWKPPPFDNTIRVSTTDLRPGEWRGYTPLTPGAPDEPLPSMPVTLPGGSRPVFEAWSLEEFRDLPGVPVLVDDGIGCCALYVGLSIQDGRRLWSVDEKVFEFSRHSYRRGIQELLILAGEEPILIKDTSGA